MGRMISLDAAGDRLSLDQRTIRKWIAEGRLTGYRVGTKALRVDIDEVDALAKPIPTASS